MDHFDLPRFLSTFPVASIQPTLRVRLGASLHQPDRVLGEGLELLAEVHFGCCFFFQFFFSNEKVNGKVSLCFFLLRLVEE